MNYILIYFIVGAIFAMIFVDDLIKQAKEEKKGYRDILSIIQVELCDNVLFKLIIFIIFTIGWSAILCYALYSRIIKLIKKILKRG